MIGDTMRGRGEVGCHRARRRRARRIGTTLAVAMLWLGLAAPAGAADYDPKEAGHPLRILAYVVHPVGVVLDYVIMRPAFWIGSHEPFSTLFGRTD